MDGTGDGDRTIVFDPYFTGPRDVVNGGYASATVAAAVDGPAEANLLRPVPVGRALGLRTHDGGATLTDGDATLATAAPADEVAIATPAPVAIDDAVRAMPRSKTHTLGGNLFDCFVCGAARADGFGVYPGPVPDRDVVAAVWRPAPALGDGDGAIAAPLWWAVLDCTGSWATFLRGGSGAPLLVRMSAAATAPVRADEVYVTVGWPLEPDGRKRPAAAALFTGDGTPVAAARLLCIEART